MGTTPAGLRYPEPTDRLSDGALAVRQLAEDVSALARMRLVKLTAPSGTLSTSTSAGTYTEVVNADFTAPASLPTSESGTTPRMLVAASLEGMWTGGAGGPSYRWALAGAASGQVRNLYSGQNSWQTIFLLDYLTPPAAGAAVQLRLQHASGSSIVCQTRAAIVAVFLA